MRALTLAVREGFSLPMVYNSGGYDSVEVLKRIEGVIVRHLVLPEELAPSYEMVDTISEISPSISVNIMDQYHPEYRAKEVPALMQRPTYREVQLLRSYAASKVTLIRR